MKARTLAHTLTLITAAALAPMAAQADVDTSEWISAELIYSEEYDDFVAVPTLSDDPFQEHLVWSDRHGDNVSVLTIKMEALQEYRNQLVWSDFHGDYLPRFILEPCPSSSSIAAPIPVAGLF